MALLTEDQQMMVEAIDQICSKLVTDDYSAELDREARYPHEVMDALAEAGWAALPVSEEAGGGGATARDLVVVHEALARHNLVVGQAYFSLWVLGVEAIERLGNEKQKAEWLERVQQGARIAFALTEPGSGSDAAALRTSAVREGDDFIVTGSKVFITGAAVADVIITAVRTSKEGRKHDGITLLMIDPSIPGVGVRKIAKMGLKGIDLCEVFFTDARIPASAVLGEVDGGWQGVIPGLAKERMLLAALSVGALRDLLERCLEYAQARTTFGKPIAGHQLIADKLVEMRVAIEAARALTLRAADLVDEDDPTAADVAAMAKLFATRAYVAATSEAVQIFGGYGFSDEYPVSRHYRDCKYLEIGGGTSEIQKIVIARSMGIRL
ncbi:acyl-CoA dehydrogenase family protein [Arthrobacter sp. FW306-2-2C-D06B]|uniref:acyl-CoA dehydrogenase family protein n=1 Tax=Arthrobacter sp. FW306-2-2C-D06B TaxID=2879618 RepID=UPI001F1AB131|nr:acyl-CoA dehydrogenase family protein [Arthrobacter sp. FW306-2-2C-D06B]UKA60450.1 acyl-CoA/acyl-ACP dehydrogenase [Arthrobacter sp. FW306-2-2C-D06B]